MLVNFITLYLKYLKKYLSRKSILSIRSILSPRSILSLRNILSLRSNLSSDLGLDSFESCVMDISTNIWYFLTFQICDLKTLEDEYDMDTYQRPRFAQSLTPILWYRFCLLIVMSTDKNLPTTRNVLKTTIFFDISNSRFDIFRGWTWSGNLPMT